MSTALKDLYSRAFIAEVTTLLQPCIKNFNAKAFTASVFNAEWKKLELKQRMRHITCMLHKVLSPDFEIAAEQLLQFTRHIQQRHGSGLQFLYMFLPDYIELYGLQHYSVSIRLFEQITQVTSAEFAVRPFIIRYPQAMMQQMLKWSKHPNALVRRLSSEGCRPRLPWAIALPEFKKDPSPVIPILEQLKNDPSETVRRSVANNLNDIAKNHPLVVLNIIKKWQGSSKETDWIIKHGSRTLLKKGNTEVMQLFGNHLVKSIQIPQLKADKNVKIGNTLQFAFDIFHTEKKPVALRIDYAIHFVKAGGKTSKKVFRLKETTLSPNSRLSIKKRQHFKDLTTRKHYPGKHQLSIIVNGKEINQCTFSVIR